MSYDLARGAGGQVTYTATNVAVQHPFRGDVSTPTPMPKAWLRLRSPALPVNRPCQVPGGLKTLLNEKRSASRPPRKLTVPLLPGFTRPKRPILRLFSMPLTFVLRRYCSRGHLSDFDKLRPRPVLAPSLS